VRTVPRRERALRRGAPAVWRARRDRLVLDGRWLAELPSPAESSGPGGKLPREHLHCRLADEPWVSAAFVWIAGSRKNGRPRPWRQMPCVSARAGWGPKSQRMEGAAVAEGTGRAGPTLEWADRAGRGPRVKERKWADGAEGVGPPPPERAHRDRLRSAASPVGSELRKNWRVYGPVNACDLTRLGVP
jgi:hypothetical protein